MWRLTISLTVVLDSSSSLASRHCEYPALDISNTFGAFLDETKRNAASNDWKDRMAELAELGKEEDTDFFKSWLRRRYARKIRERKTCTFRIPASALR